MNYKHLQEFRQQVYDLLNFAQDATFELTDAILTTRHASSLAEFSLSPFFRRQWSSTYEALQDYRCLYSAPPPYTGKGRPRKHGEKFKLNDPSTWWEATETLEVEDSKLGQVRVRLWRDLHFSGSASHGMQLILVERLLPESSRSQSKPLWLVWVGQAIPALGEIWHKYLRRFSVDHWYRFLKGRLHWTVPQLSTPQQSERWSDLMPILTWELWLARDLVAQHHLPWQKPLSHLTPGRVAQSIALLFPEIGTPAVSPKPRAKSPGWTVGNKRTPKIRYPVVKKGKARRKKRAKKAA